MSKGKETVIVTKEKDVVKGVEIDRKDHTAMDLAVAIGTGGLGFLAGRTPDDVTVATKDGGKATGTEVEFEKDN